MIRRILAAVAGYLLFIVATFAVFKILQQDPYASGIFFVIFSTIYGTIFAAIGGYLAAKLGGTAPRYEGKLVAAAIVVGAVVSIILEPRGAVAFHISSIVLMAPAAVFGARKVSPNSSADPGS